LPEIHERSWHVLSMKTPSPDGADFTFSKARDNLSALELPHIDAVRHPVVCSFGTHVRKDH
jgi:hypothetical protein